jgi:ADP-heptose:LPS heptosyltransferase
LLDWHGIRTDPEDLGLKFPAEASVAPGTIVVHPGASVPARRWGAQRFAAVARELAADHRVVVTGGLGEQDLATTVARGAGLPASAVLAGKLDLAELAALVADAALVVANDTGVAHLATAYGTPSVVLFGSAPPERWGPPPDREQHAVLRTGTLTPQEVLATAGRVLSVHL